MYPQDWTYRRMPWIPDEFLLAFVFVANQDWTYRRMPWIPDEFLLAFVFVASQDWTYRIMPWISDILSVYILMSFDFPFVR
jgi:hypothetical protein